MATQINFTPEELTKRKQDLRKMIAEYEKHLERALEEGVENLAEIFKSQIKILNVELDRLEML